MQDDEISSKSAEVESLKEQVADQDDLLLAAKRDCDSLQAEIARIQTENDSAKVPYYKTNDILFTVLIPYSMPYRNISIFQYL